MDIRRGEKPHVIILGMILGMAHHPRIVGAIQSLGRAGYDPQWAYEARKLDWCRRGDLNPHRVAPTGF